MKLAYLGKAGQAFLCNRNRGINVHAGKVFFDVAPHFLNPSRAEIATLIPLAFPLGTPPLAIPRQGKHDDARYNRFYLPDRFP